MELLTTCKQLKIFITRVSYVRRFIPALVELLEPFRKLLKKIASFQWDEKKQKAL